MPAEAWDACANPAVISANGAGLAPGDRHNPFVSHAFLSALEESGCVSRRTGWGPVHVLAEDAGGRLVAAAPCYLKSHSLGEYVFDHGWADAYERAGGRYYPKLQVSVPFTPVTGPRLLAADGDHAARSALVSGLRALRAQTNASSIHLTYLPEPDCQDLAGDGFLARSGQQFHWFNDGYASFDDFLAALASRKRKAIRRERREALGHGVTIERLTGRDITEAHWDAFWAFYQDTGARKWGHPYLTRDFFSQLGQHLADRVLLVFALRGDQPIAGALNLIGDEALYGRYWGALAEVPYLHFELCYYQAIEAAIERGLARVDDGAPGAPKICSG